MHSYLKIKNNMLYPEYCFSNYNFKYKTFNEKINKLNKDFEILLDINKQKIKRPKKKYSSLNINKLIIKLDSESSNKVLNKHQKNNKNAKKRFFSAKEIEKYKDKKRIFLKLIRSKKLNNNKSDICLIGKNSSKNRSKLNNLNNSKIFRKDDNRKKKIFQFTNKYSFSQSSSFMNTLYEQKISKNKRKNNIKRKIFGKKYLNKSSIDNNSRKEVLRDNLKDINLIKKDENQKMNNSYNDVNQINNRFNEINYYLESNYDNKDYILLKQKLNLKNLKIKVHNFENSSQYIPNDHIISKNLFKEKTFINKKFMKNNKLDKLLINNKEYYSIINDKIKKRKIYSAPRIRNRSNKTQTALKNNNLNIKRIMKTMNNINKYNSTILINKINDIQKKVQIKKRILKKEKKIKNGNIKKIMDYFINKHLDSKEIDKKMQKNFKQEFLEYQKKIGNFIKYDEKYLYAGHLSLILDNSNNKLNNLYKLKKIW